MTYAIKLNLALFSMSLYGQILIGIITDYSYYMENNEIYII